MNIMNNDGDIFLQFLILCFAVSAVVAMPQGPGYGPPRPAYGAVEEVLPPQPFAYQYGVRDGLSGNDFDKTEVQDAGGNVEGSYRVNLPDGRVQIVTYHADPGNGFVADVKYEGTAVYPPEPAGGYGAPRLVAAPAPRPYAIPA